MVASRLFRGVCVMTAVCAVGVSLHSAQGSDLFVSGFSGSVLRVNTETGLSTWVNACGGPVQSMTQVNDVMLLGDLSGNVYRVNLADDSIGYAFTLNESDNSAMATNNGELYVSDSSGTIRRVNAATGAVLQTLHSPNPVNAMIVDGGFIYVGGPTGDVHRAALTNGTFEYFACACLGVINSLAMTSDALLASDQNGTTLRFNRTNGQIIGGFTLPGDSSAMTPGATSGLFVSDSAGAVRVVNAVTGQVGATFQPGITIAAMALVTDTGPGPCLADINQDGQVNSTDFFTFITRFLTHEISSDTSTDLNHDGRVTSDDFFVFLTLFFNGCE